MIFRRARLKIPIFGRTICHSSGHAAFQMFPVNELMFLVDRARNLTGDTDDLGSLVWQKLSWGFALKNSALPWHFKARAKISQKVSGEMAT